MQPHQQRVVDEKTELDIKVKALDLFISTNPMFQKLDEAECTRLIKQLSYMAMYSDILGQRIAAF